jgi:hypothetical protein
MKKAQFNGQNVVELLTKIFSKTGNINQLEFVTSL